MTLVEGSGGILSQNFSNLEALKAIFSAEKYEKSTSNKCEKARSY